MSPHIIFYVEISKYYKITFLRKDKSFSNYTKLIWHIFFNLRYKIFTIHKSPVMNILLRHKKDIRKFFSVMFFCNIMLEL